MKKNITVFVGALIALLCLNSTSSAQDKDGEISISMTKEVNGEKKTFEKTYRSVDEMKADKDYQEFAGQDEITWLSIGDDMEKELIVKIDSKKGGAFTIATSGDEDLHVMSLSDLTEEVADIEVEIKRVLESIDEESIDQIKTIVKKIDHEDVFVVTTGNSDVNISISDPDKSDFGKGALTSEDERLDPEELELKIYGDQLIVKLPVEGSNSIKISLKDKSNEDLFVSRILEAKEDINQVIDLSQHKAGDYLLEIKIGDQRQTKKISIIEKE